MGRARFQNGWLKVSGERRRVWVGHWYEYVKVEGTEQRRPRSKVLGRCDEITEQQAQAALQALIIRRGVQRHASEIALQPANAKLVLEAESLRLQTVNVGAIGELVVAADLMARGYVVYRAMSASAPCDLVAYIAGEFCRVEVKVAERNEDGKFKRNLRLKPHCYDLLAVYSRETGRIYYEGRFSETVLEVVAAPTSPTVAAV